jgi:putative esterase
MKNRLLSICCFLFFVAATVAAQGLKFEISFSEEASPVSLDGRLLLFISTTDQPQPRFQVRDNVRSGQVFGVNVETLRPGQMAVVDGPVFGYPLQSINLLPAGEYYVQALLNRYDTYHLAGGQTVQLPASWEAGQRYNNEPGNLFSLPQKVFLDPVRGGVQRIQITEKVQPVIPAEDTKYVKHLRIKSELLSDFWGRDMYLGAHVLLPEGFDEHPNAHYPLMVFHGHFPADFGGWRTTPPDTNLEPDYSERFHISGYNRIQQLEQYDFYKRWTGADFPRFLVVEIQHANPYYDDSYAVNSANLGPYGDAITYELIPYIEQQFRGIGEGWARFLYGGSTGGWEALAVQVFYPDEYNGCFAACPDPIDFRAYTTVNIYEDKNAYYEEGPFRKITRPGHRDYLGHVAALLIDQNHKELALGDKSRSGGQWDIWEAVFSPAGEDGYPARIWDKLTGEIDPEVAAYWRENYDLRYILERDWTNTGKKLEGKIHIYCGDMDNYYLNNAVYLMEAFLESTTGPYYNGEVDYGDRAEHCWNGDQNNPNHISRLRYNTMYLPKILMRMEASAPKGADLKSWRY